VFLVASGLLPDSESSFVVHQGSSFTSSTLDCTVTASAAPRSARPVTATRPDRTGEIAVPPFIG